MHQDLERCLAAARDRVGELNRGLGRDNLDARRAAWQDQLTAERDLAAAHGEQYAQVIETGPRWDAGAPLPHVISSGSRAFVACRASQPDPDRDGTFVKVVSSAGTDPSLFVVTEMRGCSQIRFGGPNGRLPRSRSLRDGHPVRDGRRERPATIRCSQGRSAVGRWLA